MRNTDSIEPIRRFLVRSAGILCVAPASVLSSILTAATGFAQKNAGPERILLRVSQIRQETNLCVPTSAAMVMKYFGEERSPRELKTLSRGQVYDPRAKFTDFTITFFKDLIKGISGLGYRWVEKRHENDDRGFDDGLRDIINDLKNNNPVLVDTSYFKGHTFVIAGGDTAAQKLFIVDPNIPSPGVRRLTFQEFKPVWNTPGTGSRFLISTSRKS